MHNYYSISNVLCVCFFFYELIEIIMYAWYNVYYIILAYRK